MANQQSRICTRIGRDLTLSKLDGMPLKDAMPIINDLYESFGLKSMILLKDDEWINLVTVINLTRRTIEDLINEYRLLEDRIGKIDEDNFKIEFQARPISKINDLIREIQEGHLKIGELTTKIISHETKTFTDRQIGRSSLIFRVGEYAEYEHYAATLRMNDAPVTLLRTLGISDTMLGIKSFQDIAISWLGIQNLEAPINVHLFIPLYATLTGLQYQGGYEIKVNLKMHEKLLDRSKAWVIRKGPYAQARIIERKLYDLNSFEKTIQNGFIFITINHNFSGLGSEDEILVSVVNEDLGLLTEKSMIKTFFDPKISNPFSKMFSLFDARKKMEAHLLNPKSDEDLDSGFSWLLEMIDIRSLRLAKKGENISEDKVQKGSADIIAYDSNSKMLLAIDCTRGVPKGDKIDRIKNTAEYISRKTRITVKAVIITSVNAPTQKGIAEKNNVRILDLTDLDELICLFKQDLKNNMRAKILKN